MPSPTFNILLSYSGRRGLAVTHVDLFRVETLADSDELGLEELLADGLVIVEWPDRAGDLLSADRWEVSLRFVEGRPDVRHVTVVRYGNPAPLPAVGAGSATVGGR